MGAPIDIESRIAEAETRWPQLQFTRTGSGEAHSACPFCNDGVDRFAIFSNGGYWCRRCNETGWLDEHEQLSATEKRLRALEYTQRALVHKQQEHERRISALEQMQAQMEVAERYWANLHVRVDALEYWCNQGMTLETIDRYRLGYCPRCPTDAGGRDSYTIPVISNGKLWNIRHRLLRATDGDKYRPHMAGLPHVLFNGDYLRSAEGRIVITEGEKKSIIGAQAGIPNVGIMGKSGFAKEWASKFDKFNSIIVMLDPDALNQAAQIAALFGGRGKVASLPAKLDDLIVKYGATPADVEAFMRYARVV